MFIFLSNSVYSLSFLFFLSFPSLSLSFSLFSFLFFPCFFFLSFPSLFPSLFFLSFPLSFLIILSFPLLSLTNFFLPFPILVSEGAVCPSHWLRPCGKLWYLKENFGIWRVSFCTKTTVKCEKCWPASWKINIFPALVIVERTITQGPYACFN